MDAYKRILVLLDLSEDAQLVMARAVDMAKRHQASLTLVHVVEPLITDSNYVLPVMSNEVETALRSRAQTFLSDMAKKNSSVQIDVQVPMGSIKGEVFRLADETNIDLILMGTHGRHGMARLLGSTASAILHGTPIDVLAVRVGKASKD